MSNWKHDDLQRDLATHLRSTRDRVIWENMQMGPSGSPRPDVYSIPKSYTRFTPLAYEIKISVADFRSDVTSGKWQSYLNYASGVTFAVPAGLIKKSDVPEGCGLMIRNDDGWRALKAPKLRKIDTLPHEAWMKLVIDGLDRQSQPIEPRTASIWSAQYAMRQKVGERIARIVYDLASGEDLLSAQMEQMRHEHELRLGYAKKNYDKKLAEANLYKEQVSAEHALLCEAVGLPNESSTWELVFRMQEFRCRLNRDKEIERLNRVISRVRDCVGGGA